MSSNGKSTTTFSAGISRRNFLGQAGAAAAGLTIVPRSVLGGAGQAPPSGKINMAFIGVGSQGLRVMLSFLRQEDVQAVAVCDPNRESSDYPQWSKNEFCDAVGRLVGTTSGWEWLSPNQPIQLTETVTATGGTAGREPCRKIVEGYYGSRKRSGVYNGCKAYSDFRELLDKEKDLDAVVVCSTDNLHAAVSVAAMQKGKHVFCQKPMTHTVYEARRMAEVAQKTGVATQVAVANQASEDTRRICDWIQSGTIGAVREVHNWSSRPFWAQGLERPRDVEPVPPGLDWDLWLGPAPERPFNHIYLPFVWRGWYDFGCGALGDMGQYSFDTIFRALKLGAPTSVEASAQDHFAETFPRASIVHFQFPARDQMPPVKLTWYDGGLKPPQAKALAPGRKGDEESQEGLLFIGERGMILCGFNGSRPRIVGAGHGPDKQPPAQRQARGAGGNRHLRQWLDACRGSKTTPGANFEFSGRVAEALLLGNVALRTSGKSLWDAENLRVANQPSADQYIRPERRPGWPL
jgi:predicted dehydrogenase